MLNDDVQFTFNNQLSLTEAQIADIEIKYRTMYAETKGLTLEEYDAQQAAERQKYIDDPTLADREAAEMTAKFRAELKAMDDEFFVEHGVRLLGDEYWAEIEKQDAQDAYEHAMNSVLPQQNNT